MLHCHMFSIGGTDCARHMDELTLKISVLINFFLSKESFSWETDFLVLLYITDYKYWVCVVAS